MWLLLQVQATGVGDALAWMVEVLKQFGLYDTFVAVMGAIIVISGAMYFFKLLRG